MYHCEEGVNHCEGGGCEPLGGSGWSSYRRASQKPTRRLSTKATAIVYSPAGMSCSTWMSSSRDIGSGRLTSSVMAEAKKASGDVRISAITPNSVRWLHEQTAPFRGSMDASVQPSSDQPPSSVTYMHEGRWSQVSLIQPPSHAHDPSSSSPTSPSWHSPRPEHGTGIEEQLASASAASAARAFT